MTSSRTPLGRRATGLTRRHWLTRTAAAAPLAIGGRALAQGAWPTKPVRLVVPFTAGGAADTSARHVGARIATGLGQQLVIENRTGGAAVIAAQAVLQAPRDGYTFLWDAANQLTNPVLINNLPFDYANSFVPVSLAVRAPQALVVRANFPARTLEEFIDAARKAPGTISCGTPPNGAMGHLALAMFQQRAGIKLIHSPYRGGADAARDVMGGQIDAALITVSTAGAGLREGRTRVLAITSAARIAAYPDVPTIAERGFAGYDMDDWFGLFAAAGTPAEAVRRMQAATAAAVKDAELMKLVAPLGMELVGNSSEEFGAWLNQQRPLLHKLIKDNNITVG